MKISKLLSTRHSIRRQAHLAGLASAYLTLRCLADRVAAAKLRGRVRLQPVAPREDRYWPALTALEGSQARIEEHFADDDLLDLADAIVLAIDSDYAELEFNLEDLAANFVAPLRTALHAAGVVLDLDDEQPDLAAGSQPSEPNTP